MLRWTFGYAGFENEDGDFQNRAGRENLKMYLFKTTNAAYGCDWKSVDSTSIMGRRIPSVSFVMGNVPPSHRRPIQMGLRFDEDSGLKVGFMLFHTLPTRLH